jgi:hypothetical protein
MTLNVDTLAVSISAKREEVFEYLADPANLPRWAVGFARGVRRDGDTWIVETAQGDVPIRIVTNSDVGTIDSYMTVAPGTEHVAYSRVVPNGAGAEYIFTLFQGPGMSDETFASQRAALAEELAILPLLFRAQMACPIGR